MSHGPGNRDNKESPRGAEQSPPPKAPSNPAASYGLIGIGMEFLATICFGGAIGWYLDRRMHTFPWLLLTGAGIGFIAGLVMMIRAGRQAFKD